MFCFHFNLTSNKGNYTVSEILMDSLYFFRKNPDLYGELAKGQSPKVSHVTSCIFTSYCFFSIPFCPKTSILFDNNSMKTHKQNWIWREPLFWDLSMKSSIPTFVQHRHVLSIISQLHTVYTSYTFFNYKVSYIYLSFDHNQL